MTSTEPMPDKVRSAYLRIARDQCPAMTTVYRLAARSLDVADHLAVDQLFTYVAELMQRECDHLPGERVPDADESGDVEPESVRVDDEGRAFAPNGDRLN